MKDIIIKVVVVAAILALAIWANMIGYERFMRIHPGATTLDYFILGGH